MQRNHDESIKHHREIVERITANGEVMLDDRTRELKAFWRLLGRTVLARLNFVTSLGTEIKRTTGQILASLLSLTNMLHELQSLLTNMDWSFEQQFVLEDATGRTLKIYMTNIPNWEAFQFFLQQRFKGKKGSRRVLRRRYILQERSSLLEIDHNMEWESLFQSRQMVDMSLLCSDFRDRASRPSCPWCKTASSSDSGQEVQW